MTGNHLEHTLHDYVRLTLENYFQQLGEQSPVNLYQMVTSEVEKALFKTVLHYTCDNQSKAAQCLGMSRGTLRKKLKQYNMESIEK
jgi:Fis family transcriptional regulator, factor for inversion stimulation protein